MRTYTTTEGLVPLTEPDRDDDVLVKPFPVVWRPRAELPSRDDTPRELLQMRDELDDVGGLDPWTDRTGLKVGGWPRTIQSETSWHLERHGLVADAEFVLQIDSDEKSQLFVGDAGAAYIAWSPTNGWLLSTQYH